MEDRDPFVASIMRAIDQRVLLTFTHEQERALRSALETHSRRKHAVDIRGTIPLFFTRLYFVILVGKDRRRHSRRVHEERRAATRQVNLVLFLAGILVALSLLTLVFLYLLKWAFGVDLIGDAHLYQLLGF